MVSAKTYHVHTHSELTMDHGASGPLAKVFGNEDQATSQPASKEEETVVG